MAENAAFACMALSTVIGTLVARRGQLVSIAVLSMIGGNLAPALLTSPHPQLFGFPYISVHPATDLAGVGGVGCKPQMVDAAWPVT